ncbi:uncharacterized protein A1O9_05986 [Exophiala aquamarina CBS 119918]|uniref:Uncharacterized protein n=1 Tax=Exophiala aquamarina CBS 119918 TaxID=1182545 RepID=A0A072PFK7_9EURO|nr:uncharacterized protein A1O9_05986 [Exophiala aquamarina CBS 119918]KEF58063.1 hypothetical protein A1O9_05986 [Exophiala aquamarina CBS 119918]
MTASWINLPGSWSLQNVQTALNVIVTGLSVLAVFACARFCWQSSVTSGARYDSVPASALLSISAFGDAVDVIWLLKVKIFSRRHVKILVQACLVVFLSLAALISGPIARYSTRLSHRISNYETPGKITWRKHDSILGAPVIWNTTSFSLESANFPYDQLLDYLPDPAINWLYVPGEWNSSWTLDCDHTELTQIELEDVGNCTSMFDEIPGLTAVISLDKFHLSNTSSWWTAYYEDGLHKDALLSIGAAKETSIDQATGITNEMAIDLAAIHLHKLSMQEDSDSLCNFGEGPVESASYTKIECTLRRIDLNPDQHNIAFPDSATPWLVSRALVQNYQAQFIRESIRGNITVITPRDLTRFYQVWVATKDTQNGFPVSRSLSVRLPIVQLSTVFLAFSILIFMLIVLGLGTYIFAALRYRKAFEDTPQSKLEWMLKALQDQDPTQTAVRTPPDKKVDVFQSSATPLSPKSLKRSSTAGVLSIASSVQQSGEKRRSVFENARYSNTQTRNDDDINLQEVGHRYEASPYSSDGLSFGSGRLQPESLSIRSQSGSAIMSDGYGRQVYASEPGPPLEQVDHGWNLPPLPFSALGSNIPRKPVGSAYTSVSITELPSQARRQPQQNHTSASWLGPRHSDTEGDHEVERLVLK